MHNSVSNRSGNRSEENNLDNRDEENNVNNKSEENIHKDNNDDKSESYRNYNNDEWDDESISTFATDSTAETIETVVEGFQDSVSSLLSAPYTIHCMLKPHEQGKRIKTGHIRFQPHNLSELLIHQLQGIEDLPTTLSPSVREQASKVVPVRKKHQLQILRHEVLGIRDIRKSINAEKFEREQIRTQMALFTETHDMHIAVLIQLVSTIANQPRPTEIKKWLSGMVKKIRTSWPANVSWFDKTKLLKRLNYLEASCRTLTSTYQAEVRQQRKNMMCDDPELTAEENKSERTRRLKRNHLWKVQVSAEDEDQTLMKRVKDVVEGTEQLQQWIISIASKHSLRRAILLEHVKKQYELEHEHDYRQKQHASNVKIQHEMSNSTAAAIYITYLEPPIIDWTTIEMQFELEERLETFLEQYEEAFAPCDIHQQVKTDPLDPKELEELQQSFRMRDQQASPPPRQPDRCHICHNQYKITDFVITHYIDDRGRSNLGGLGCHHCCHPMLHQTEYIKKAAEVFGIEVPPHGFGHGKRMIRWSPTLQRFEYKEPDEIVLKSPISARSIIQSVEEAAMDERRVNSQFQYDITEDEQARHTSTMPHLHFDDTLVDRSNKDMALAIIEVIVEARQEDQLAHYERIKFKAQLDRGATVNCINYTEVSRLGIRTHLLKRKMRIVGVGGTQVCDSYVRLSLGIFGQNIARSVDDKCQGRITILTDCVIVKGLDLPLLIGASTLKRCNVIHSNEGDFSTIGWPQWEVSLKLQHVGWKCRVGQGVSGAIASTSVHVEEVDDGVQTLPSMTMATAFAKMTEKISAIKPIDSNVKSKKGHKVEPITYEYISGQDTVKRLEDIKDKVIERITHLQSNETLNKAIQLTSRSNDEAIAISDIISLLPDSITNTSVLASIAYLHWGQIVLQLDYNVQEVINQGPSHTHHEDLVNQIISYAVLATPMTLRRQQFHQFRKDFAKWLTSDGKIPQKPTIISSDLQMIIDEWNDEVDDNIEGLGNEYTTQLESHIERPSFVPEEVWKYISDVQKPLVASRWAKYPLERRQTIIHDIDKIDICAERPKQRPYIRGLVWANIDAYYHVEEEDPPTIPDVEMRIFTNTDQPTISRRNQHFSPIERIFLDVKTRIMVRSGKIEESCSPYRAPLVLVQYPDRVKDFISRHPDNSVEAMQDPKNEAEVATFFRLTVDMRLLNAETIADKHPLPRIMDVIDCMEGHNFFSCGDIADAFWSVKVAEQDRHKTAFATHNNHFQWRVMPQGAKNAAVIFARMIRQSFSPPRSGVDAYQDDVFNYAKTFRVLLEHMQYTFDRMRENCMVFKRSKAKINYPRMKVLGHIITKRGRIADPGLVQAVLDFKPPRTQKGIMTFLGLANYNRDYIKQISHLTEPLAELLDKNVDVPNAWTEERHGAAFRAIKSAFCKAPILQLPDFSKAFRVEIDGCTTTGRGIGACLMQPTIIQEGNIMVSQPAVSQEGKAIDKLPKIKWSPIAYYSKLISARERKRLSATEVEARALHEAIMHWAPYLQNGQTFDVVVDHKALVYLIVAPTATGNKKLLRYALNLQGFSFNVIFENGKKHLCADAISRLFRYEDLDMLDDEDLPTNSFDVVDRETILTLLRQLSLDVDYIDPDSTLRQKQEDHEVVEVIASTVTNKNEEVNQIAKAHSTSILDIYEDEPSRHGPCEPLVVTHIQDEDGVESFLVNNVMTGEMWTEILPTCLQRSQVEDVFSIQSEEDDTISLLTDDESNVMTLPDLNVHKGHLFYKGGPKHARLPADPRDPNVSLWHISPQDVVTPFKTPYRIHDVFLTTTNTKVQNPTNEELKRGHREVHYKPGDYFFCCPKKSNMFKPNNWKFWDISTQSLINIEYILPDITDAEFHTFLDNDVPLTISGQVTQDNEMDNMAHHVKEAGDYHNLNTSDENTYMIPVSSERHILLSKHHTQHDTLTRSLNTQSHGTIGISWSRIRRRSTVVTIGTYKFGYQTSKTMWIPDKNEETLQESVITEIYQPIFHGENLAYQICSSITQRLPRQTPRKPSQSKLAQMEEVQRKKQVAEVNKQKRLAQEMQKHIAPPLITEPLPQQISQHITNKSKSKTKSQAKVNAGINADEEKCTNIAPDISGDNPPSISNKQDEDKEDAAHRNNRGQDTPNTHQLADKTNNHQQVTTNTTPILRLEQQSNKTPASSLPQPPDDPRFTASLARERRRLILQKQRAEHGRKRRPQVRPIEDLHRFEPTREQTMHPLPEDDDNNNNDEDNSSETSGRRLRREAIEKERQEISVKELEVHRFNYLLGRNFIHPLNRRLYEVINIYYDIKEKAYGAFRWPADGEPAGNDERFAYAVEGNRGIEKLVKLYAERAGNTNQLMAWPRSEDDMRKIQEQDIVAREIIANVKRRYSQQGKMSYEGNKAEGERTYLIPMLANGNEGALRVKKQRGKRIKRKEHHDGDDNDNDEEEPYLDHDEGIEDGDDLIYLPDSLTGAVMRYFHDAVGHTGADRMIASLALRYYWPFMKSEVEEYVSSCRYCKLRKRKTGAAVPNFRTLTIATRPFERTYIDLVGRFKKSATGYHYICVIMCALTHWIELIPLFDNKAITVARAINENILLRHGSIQTLVTDKGTEFYNQLLKALNDLCRVRHIYNTTANPQANAVERANGTLKDMLASFVSANQEDWDVYLPIIAHAYRTTVNTATGFTPFRMLYGREARQPSESWIETFAELKKIDINEYIRRLTESLLFSWGQGAEIMAQRIKKIRDDQHKIALIAKPHARIFRPFRRGQQFYLSTTPKRHFKSLEEERTFKLNAKLTHRYTGPHIVEEVINPVTYIANVNGRLQPVHASKMKRDGHNDDAVIYDIDIPNIPARTTPMRSEAPHIVEARTMPNRLIEYNNNIDLRNAQFMEDPLRKLDHNIDEAAIDLDNYSYTNNEFLNEVVQMGKHWELPDESD